MRQYARKMEDKIPRIVGLQWTNIHKNKRRFPQKLWKNLRISGEFSTKRSGKLTPIGGKLK